MPSLKPFLVRISLPSSYFCPRLLFETPLTVTDLSHRSTLSLSLSISICSARPLLLSLSLSPPLPLPSPPYLSTRDCSLALLPSVTVFSFQRLCQGGELRKRCQSSGGGRAAELILPIFNHRCTCLSRPHKAKGELGYCGFSFSTPPLFCFSRLFEACPIKGMRGSVVIGAH